MLHKGIYAAAVSVRGEQSVFARLKRLRALQYSPPAVVRHHQEELLSDLLRHALTGVPRFRSMRRWASDVEPGNARAVLAELPVAEKEEVQREPEFFWSTNWSGRYATKTTGGSTGRPVSIRKNSAAIAQEMAATWLAYEWFGIQPGDRCIRFWGQPQKNWRRRLRYMAADVAVNRRTLSAFGYDNDKLDAYVRFIATKRPRYLYGYVSALDDLAWYVLNHQLQPPDSIVSVVTTSEVLTSPQRNRIRTAFRSAVQNEYGCGEVGPIAYECPVGSLHLLPTNQIVEIVDANGNPVGPGEWGSVLITDLTNFAMPLIRYRVGDNAVVGRACACGRSFPVIQEVLGRAYDYVEAPGGRRYHGEFFMYVFEDLRGVAPGVHQFQVVQTASLELEVRVTSDGATISQVEKELVRRELNKRLPGFSIRVTVVDRLERRPSGKMMVVENRVTSRSTAPA